MQTGDIKQESDRTGKPAKRRFAGPVPVIIQHIYGILFYKIFRRFSIAFLAFPAPEGFGMVGAAGLWKGGGAEVGRGGAGLWKGGGAEVGRGAAGLWKGGGAEVGRGAAGVGRGGAAKGWKGRRSNRGFFKAPRSPMVRRLPPRPYKQKTQTVPRLGVVPGNDIFSRAVAG